MAQDKFEVSLEADVVSKYVWRGFDQGSGASVQPSLGLAYKGVSLSAWGSTSITDLEPKEFDITLGYSIGGFSITVTDYGGLAKAVNMAIIKTAIILKAH